jgi:hypothetical protein
MCPSRMSTFSARPDSAADALASLDDDHVDVLLA